MLFINEADLILREQAVFIKKLTIMERSCFHIDA